MQLQVIMLSFVVMFCFVSVARTNHLEDDLEDDRRDDRKNEPIEKRITNIAKRLGLYSKRFPNYLNSFGKGNQFDLQKLMKSFANQLRE